MSRVYFQSPTGDAELHGSERGWLRHIALGPSIPAWDVSVHTELEDLAEIVALIPEVPDGAHGANYLHAQLRAAQAEQTRSRAAYTADVARGGRGFGHYDPEPLQRLRRSLQLRLQSGGEDTVMRVAGHDFHCGNINLNTALVAGSPPIQLAAKIHGWCESHAWVDGPDRAWMADIIDTGLRIGIYRRGLWYAKLPNGPKDTLSDQGWDQITTLLRARDDEPVVMSYSVGDSFPNREITDWRSDLSDDWRPDWATDRDGVQDWAGLSEDDRLGHRRDGEYEVWDALPDQQRWDLAMAGLKRRRPWAQLSPDNLGDTTFGHGVTVYDLKAPDRDERVQAIMAASAEVPA